MRTVTRDRSQVRVGPCHRPQREARPAHGAMDLRTDDRGALPARRSRGHPPRTDRSRAVDRQGPHAATPVFRSNQSGTSTSDSWELSAWKEARRRNGKRRRLQPVCPTGPGRVNAFNAGTSCYSSWARCSSNSAASRSSTSRTCPASSMPATVSSSGAPTATIRSASITGCTPTESPAGLVFVKRSPARWRTAGRADFDGVVPPHRHERAPTRPE